MWLEIELRRTQLEAPLEVPSPSCLQRTFCELAEPHATSHPALTTALGGQS